KYELDPNRNQPVPHTTSGGIGVSRSALTVEATDASGRLHVQVVSCFNGAPEQHPKVACSVDPSFVVVGGGARTFYSAVGALLTETRPFDGQLQQWVAASKDHGTGDAHYLQAYAIGMRLDGVSRADLLAQMQLKSVTSGIAPHPLVDVSTDEGFTMIGGG